VSVLFADLVGFTPLSESRDAEEVRELLSRYFESCRRLVELYGGTVEKFIGDAVMAVWGTPVALEGRRRAGGPHGPRSRRGGRRARRRGRRAAVAGARRCADG
jgi:class 3 adenylate cyclase